MQTLPAKIASSLVKAQKEFGPALKNSSNPHFRSRYADLSVCVEAVIDSLNNNGIALTQHVSPCENGVIVETVFIHESGEIINCGKLHVPATKQDAQGYGSALTYARRYSLMSACGIAPEDDDGNAASRKNPLPRNNSESISIERYIEAIKNSSDREELMKFYQEAYNNFSNDKASIEKIIEAKKYRLEVAKRNLSPGNIAVQ